MLDCVKTVGDSIQIATGVLSTLTLQPQNMLKALTPDMLATGQSLSHHLRTLQYVADLNFYARSRRLSGQERRPLPRNTPHIRPSRSPRRNENHAHG